ncbi:ABC transporter permease [Labrys sp. KB_33_2]|uniref:ABC transporter permease n=1 Tax=unclassified Labrys (in: a-proteobacteria) TaxID=2688601 RepID=UPI003EB7C1E0
MQTDETSGTRPFFRPVLRVLRWLLSVALTLFGLIVVTFVLTRLSTIDPALQQVGDHASQSSYEAARRELGLDQPLVMQFLRYLGHVVQGDLGIASSTGQPVRSDILRTFTATLELATAAALIGALLGLALGILAALRPRGLFDNIARLLSLIGYSTPIFWLGLIFLLLFYARLHWAPGPGRLDIVFQYTMKPVTGFALIDAWLSGTPGALRSALAHLVLPTAVLALYAMAGISRLTRAAILEQLSKEYVLTARAKGAGALRVVLVHILPNVAGTLITVIALAYASLLEGAVLTETVFAWPGIGRYLTVAMFAGDTAAILGSTLAIGMAFVLLNSLTDLIVTRVDPAALAERS